MVVGCAISYHHLLKIFFEMQNVIFWRETWDDIGCFLKAIQTPSLEVSISKSQPYRCTFPVRNNFGSVNGECVYKSLEECCRSLKKPQYDEDFWLRQKGVTRDNIKGVDINELASFINSSNILTCHRIYCLSEIISANKFNERVIICKENHAAVIYELRKWDNGYYEIEIAETSPKPQFCDDSEECEVSIVKGRERIDGGLIALFAVSLVKIKENEK